ncbi:hypothetical protein ASPCADRAFT_208748 [Aspergillus carbonarius ITEM 5010]|uniref:Uncharacterized protein n=1 Tax=Aspergillus carbonarius (strain ITEM 5010) TaxID=602072 RepID=A0A1R3RIC8_ASPC5|nr:hypothetical protein ASPCADRAFT_208748 [Aspergillus carbonarius ITEM 5010]
MGLELQSPLDLFLWTPIGVSPELLHCWMGEESGLPTVETSMCIAIGWLLDLIRLKPLASNPGWCCE